MKRIFTFLVGLFAVTLGMAQAPTGVFAKATIAPVIDGVVDAVWAEATVYNIDKNFQTDLPTLGTPGQTTWQGLWTDEGVYILLKVTDNAFFPNYMATPPSPDTWQYDKPELYFDMNSDNLVDGKGPSAGGTGHYQVGPGFTLDKNDGTPFTQGDGVIYAFKVTGSNYIAEYFVPYNKLRDITGLQVDRTSTIGFDVTVIDRDPGQDKRNSAVWANIGALDGSWGNMNDAGQVTFADGTATVSIDAITATTTGKITTDKGTLQMLATVTPANATYKGLNWTIEGGTAQVTMTSTGLITAVSNGTVIVKGATTDGSYLYTELTTVTITGQSKIKYTDETWNTANIIKNWNYNTDLTDWGGWVDPAAIPSAIAPVIVDGVAVMKVAKHADTWRYQHNQSPLAAEGNVEYTFKFKSWSTGTSPCTVDFESASNIESKDGGDKQVRYGVSTDKESNNKTSEWNYTATVLPSWFTFHVTFDKLMATTVQKLQWLISSSDQTISLDSVLLAKTSDIVSITGISNQLSNSMKVYPNPVGQDKFLTIQLLSSVNTKVAIYNAIGQKMMEKVSTGNVARFDVSSLRKGLYFVKLADGTTQKFIK